MGRGLRQAGQFDSRGEGWRLDSPHLRRQRRRIAELCTADCTLSRSATRPSGTHRRRLESHDKPSQARHGSRDEPAQTSLSCLRADGRAACPRSPRPRAKQVRRNLDVPANLADKVAPRRCAAPHRRRATTPLRTAAILTVSSELSPAARVNWRLRRHCAGSTSARRRRSRERGFSPRASCAPGGPSRVHWGNRAAASPILISPSRS